MSVPRKDVKPTSRGTCAECGFRFRLNLSGRVGLHYLYAWYSTYKCPGSWRPPESLGRGKGRKV